MFSEVEVFQQPATHRIVLDAQGMVEIRTVHLAFLRKYVPHTTRNLAADGDTAVPSFMRQPWMTVFCEGVLRRRPSAFRGFYGDAIVTCVEVTILDQHVSARLRIASVVVWSVTADSHLCTVTFLQSTG